MLGLLSAPLATWSANITANTDTIAKTGTGDDERVATGYLRLQELKADGAIRSITAPFIEAINKGDRVKAARYLLLIAYGFRMDDNDDSAAVCATIASNLDPNNALALVLAADYLSRAGRLDEADSKWKRLDKFPQNDPIIMRGRAHQLFSHNKLDEAAQVLRQAIERNSEEVTARHMLAMFHSVRGEREAATKCFDALVKLSTDEYQKKMYAGLSASCQGDQKKAEAMYLAAGSIRPSDPAWHDALAMLYMGQKKTPEARAHIEEAAKCSRLSSQIAFNYAAILVFSGEQAKAIRLLQRITELKPTSFRAHNALGTTYKAAGKASEAEQEFQTAVELHSRKNSSYSNLLGLEHVRNDEKKTRAIVAKWTENNPESWDCLAANGVLCLKANQWKEAQDFFTRAEQNKPHQRKDEKPAVLKLCSIYSGLATACYKQNDLKGALANAQLFNSTKPAPDERGGVPVRPPKVDFAALKPASDQLKAAEHAVIADTLYETKQYEDSAAEYNKAIANEPENIAWHAALLKVYIDKRDIAGAAKEDLAVSQHMINKVGEVFNFGKKEKAK